MLAVWHATCYRPGRLQLVLVGFLAGALVAAKISSLYTVAAGLTIFLIAVWSSYRTLGQVVRTMLSLGLVAAGSYLCFAAPYFEYALHPLFATLRALSVANNGCSAYSK